MCHSDRPTITLGWPRVKHVAQCTGLSNQVFGQKHSREAVRALFALLVSASSHPWTRLHLVALAINDPTVVIVVRIEIFEAQRPDRSHLSEHAGKGFTPSPRAELIEKRPGQAGGLAALQCPRVDSCASEQFGL